MKKSVLFCLCFYFATLTLAQVPKSFPAVDDEFVGPFPSWINVKTFGAVGDGVTDETAAIQAAFDAIGNDRSSSSVVYIPPGIYRITDKLKINFKINISIIGDDPASTIIRWNGKKNGIMMEVNGTAYSRFNRITWDGTNAAYAAIDQSWDGTQPHFDTGNEYADNVFINAGIGIQGGSKGYGFAETSIMRCKFIKNSIAGISLGNFNALDIWVWSSLFQDCALGVTNVYGAGNFKIYNSVFKNSIKSDIRIGNTGEFSFRDNTSINSQAFITTEYTSNPANILIQNNQIIDPVSNVAIEIKNQGPITFLDNTIRSRVSAIGPVVINEAYPNSDFFSMGNTYTVNSALQVRGLVFDDTVVERSSLSKLMEPIIPGVQPNLNRKVFEVPRGSNVLAIQQIINEAAKLTGTRPVIHLPYEIYSISSTLTIPAGSDMQIVGDGDGDVHPTLLKWSGTTEGPVIKIIGPNKATFRDFSINGNGIANNIIATNIDQIGSRVFMHELEVNSNKTNLLVNGLDYTQVVAINSGFSGSSEKSISVIGGPQATDRLGNDGKTIIFAGAESDNNLSHQVIKGANLLIRDVWYESNKTGQYLNLSDYGTISIDGSHITSPQVMPQAQTSLTNFAGKVTFLSTNISDRIEATGDGTQTKLLGLSNYSEHKEYINNNTFPSADIRSFNTRARDLKSDSSGSGSYSVNDIGTPDISFMRTMLAPIRSVHVPSLTSLPDDVSDLRFYRIWTTNGLTGLELKSLDVLNVTFLSLNSFCDKKVVTLNWKTAKELGTKRFDIERSYDGVNWNIIGSVPVSDNNYSVEKDYNYTDIGTNTSVKLYRIVEIDNTGHKVTSSVVKSSCFASNESFQVNPNPVIGIFTVSITTDEVGRGSFKLYNSEGQLVKKLEVRLSAGGNSIPVNINNLPAGNYLLVGEWQQKVKVFKILKM